MNNHSLRSLFGNTTNTAQSYSPPSLFSHAEETEYMPTLIIETRRVPPKRFKRLLGSLEGLCSYACPLDLGDKCSRIFKNCAEVKAHIFWHFNAFQCETCGRCFGKSDGLNRHAKSTAKCAEGRSKTNPILSLEVKQRVEKLQNARGYDAIKDAINGWVLDFKLPDATSPTFAISRAQRNYQQGTRKPSWRKQGYTRLLNVDTNVLMNGLEYQMPYEQDTNPWQPAAVSFINNPSLGDANMASLEYQMPYEQDTNSWQPAAVSFINNSSLGDANMASLEYQMPHEQDTNSWQPAAVSFINSPSWASYS